jgi:hypothetical protein
MTLPIEALDALKRGACAVSAHPQVGPHVKAVIISLIPRSDLLEMFAKLRNFTTQERKSFTASVTSAVKQAVLNKQEPNLNEDLMGDLPLLLVIHLTERKNERRQKNLTKSGLLFLGLAISEDETLPWRERGMLDPLLLEQLGLSPKPVYI